MSRYQFTHGDERWWVGYDLADAAFFRDHDVYIDFIRAMWSEPLAWQEGL